MISIGLVQEDGGGRVAVVERGGVDEGLERRARLALRLGGAVERGLVEGEAADHGEDAPGERVHGDNGAGNFGNLAQPHLAGLAVDRLDEDHVADGKGLSQLFAHEAGVVGGHGRGFAVARDFAGFLLGRLQADAQAVIDLQHHGEPPGRDIAERRDVRQRRAPVAADRDLLVGAAIAMGLVEPHQPVDQRLARHQLHVRVERGAHRQAALVELLVAIAVVQLAAHLLDEIAGGESVGGDSAA